MVIEWAGGYKLGKMYAFGTTRYACRHLLTHLDEVALDVVDKGARDNVPNHLTYHLDEVAPDVVNKEAREKSPTLRWYLTLWTRTEAAVRS